jgi:hypothetical protein
MMSLLAGPNGSDFDAKFVTLLFDNDKRGFYRIVCNPDKVFGWQCGKVDQDDLFGV